MIQSRLERLSLLIICAIYLGWSGLFIYQSSYIALDGHRYFGLFDDAMISMRYAWNFAHGQGLVWNGGQRVEGYTNLLMTLLMSLPAVFLSKPLAVLAVQVLGVATMLGIAFMARQLAYELVAGPEQRVIGLMGMLCVLAYYPLNYWTLMGMETGLLALFTLSASLFALRWLRTRGDSDLIGMALVAGLAFLARNDSLIPMSLIFAFLAVEGWLRKWKGPVWTRLLQAAGLYVAFPAAQTVFRLAYYGELLPNTYVLKLAHFPVSIRVIGGLHFIAPFLAQATPLFVLAALALLFDFGRARLLLCSFIIAALAYQVYVGGDPWPSWRMLAPALPPLLLLAVIGSYHLVSRFRMVASRGMLTASLAFLLLLLAVFVADQPFLGDMSVRAPTSAAIANHVNTNAAIAITNMTRPGATVGVIWAGTLPYYADRQAIDFLGKSDPYIASRNADVSGAVSWSGMVSVPGHNKYDLDYSIVRLQPIYIQAYAWGNQTVKPWVMQNYVRVEYHDIQGEKTLFLRRDSPYVCWNGCGNDYTIVPWPKQGQDSP